MVARFCESRTLAALIALVVLILARPARGQAPAPASPAQVPVATQGEAMRALQAARSGPAQTRPQLFGFRSSSEAQSSSLGAPLSVYLVPLDRLRAYRAGDDPLKLLSTSTEVIYPVVVGSEVRSSVTVQNVGGVWRSTSLGLQHLAAKLVGARRQDAASSKQSESAYFEVAVPALNLRFLARPAANSIVLIPMQDYAAIGLRTGGAYPAGDVFGKLVALAQANNGKPG